MKLILTLDLQFFAGEKTEKATPKKRQDARKKGQVLKSQDVTAAILLLILFLFLFFIAPSMLEGIISFLTQALHRNMLIETVSIETVMKMYTDAFKEMALDCTANYGDCDGCRYWSKLFAVWFLFTTETLKFDLKKMDPIKGIKKIISVRAIINLIKSLLKVTLLV